MQPQGLMQGFGTCGPGYHWDVMAHACVPDQQQGSPTSQQGGMDPMQAYNQYKQFMPGTGAGATSGTGTGSGWGAVGNPGAITGQGAGGGGVAGGSGASPAAGGVGMGWWAAFAAAIAATSHAMNKNHISSYKDQLIGDMPNDVLNSQYVTTHAGDIFGKKGGKDFQDTLRPYADMHGVHGFKDLAHDVPQSFLGSFKLPFHALGRLFS